MLNYRLVFKMALSLVLLSPKKTRYCTQCKTNSICGDSDKEIYRDRKLCMKILWVKKTTCKVNWSYVSLVFWYSRRKSTKIFNINYTGFHTHCSNEKRIYWSGGLFWFTFKYFITHIKKIIHLLVQKYLKSFG